MNVPVAVIVPTRGDAAALDRIKTNISDHLRGIPLLIIANTRQPKGQSSHETAGCCFEILHAPGGGVARARNHGLRVARSEVLVFLDDDVIVNRRCIDVLVDPIINGHADVTTARVIPARELPCHPLYRSELGLDRGCVGRQWHRDTEHLSPFHIWDVGVGAAFALRACIQSTTPLELRFDERLSNGTFAGSTEDVDFFYQCYVGGLRIRYCAEAVVEHIFPEDRVAVARRWFRYALSDGAFYAKWAKNASIHDIVGELWRFVSTPIRSVVARLRQEPTVGLLPSICEPFLKLVGAAYWICVSKRCS